jgi:hypothetical protein
MLDLGKLEFPTCFWQFAFFSLSIEMLVSHCLFLIISSGD